MRLMANKELSKVYINKERFIRTLKSKKKSFRKLGSGDAYNVIQRTERIIRQYVTDEKMPPDLLKRIAQYLDVSPDYLSGQDVSESLPEGLKRYDEPENHPYIFYAIKDIDYKQFFSDALTSCRISMEDFKSKPLDERVRFHQELNLAILEVVAKHFVFDSVGGLIADELDYQRSIVNDDELDPFSYFAKFEGIEVEEWDEPTPEDKPNALEEKYKKKYKDFNQKQD